MGELAEEPAKTLSIIYNQLWLTGEVPDDWKLASVTPIHKKGQKEDLEKHRPVSLTSVPSSIMEQIILSMMACDPPMDIIHLDVSKAFDIISHNILLEKLAAHGLDRCIPCWIRNWLGDRAQRVVVEGAASSWRLVASGVPQG
ncbi:hypothetical protein DUI87_09151 [Hirundo rustica rustica]|uniref:Reverse transcriptase domain-containing protein n=1 Tax=Hirundo rustica rustica TaxID=333673 RepID=A0A3M0KRT3_HIRRU|nr:hypothetical protein DUI87_09151 [Hirundo rustica rustica]